MTDRYLDRQRCPLNAGQRSTRSGDHLDGDFAAPSLLRLTLMTRIADGHRRHGAVGAGPKIFVVCLAVGAGGAIGIRSPRGPSRQRVLRGRRPMLPPGQRCRWHAPPTESLPDAGYVAAAMWIACLSRRLPLRETLWRTWTPEDASIGAVLLQEANDRCLAKVSLGFSGGNLAGRRLFACCDAGDGRWRAAVSQ